MKGSDILDKAKSHLGETYVLGAHAPLANANWTGPWDCAEYTSWLAYQTYGIVYGCGTTDLDRADPYSGHWASEAQTRGIAVSASQAAVTPGAFLVRVPVTGTVKRIGHVAIAIGDGQVYEAAGAQLGVRIGPVAGRRWDLGVLLPGVDYTGNGAPPGPTAIAVPPVPRAMEPLVLRQQSPARFDERVVEVQLALKERGIDPGKIDGQFGPATEAAVFSFQIAKGLLPDGEVGPITGAALGLPFWSPTAAPGPGVANAPAMAPLSNPPAAIGFDAFGAVVDVSTKLADIREGYSRLFAACVVQDRNAEIGHLCQRIVQNKQRYVDFVAGYRDRPNKDMPWFFVALVHAMEASGDIGRFKTHLHNGDPLTKPTVHVPAGRPNTTGTNFSWEESARDALSLKKLDTQTDWSLPQLLYLFEKFNGFGPRLRGHATAYLWSYSNLYIKGKFIADGVWDENATSRQPGAATILKQLVDDGTVSLS